MPDLPREHPREQIVRDAECKLGMYLVDEIRSLLTNAEYMRVVVSVLGDSLSRLARYAIRHERHGDLDKPGGLE